MNKSKVRLMTPSEACILLQAYINSVKRLKANEYKRNNERAYDLKKVSFVNKYQIRLLTSIGVFNKSGMGKAMALGDEALWLEVEVRDWEFDVELQRDALNDKN